MGGGLLNLVSEGAKNYILTGNPSISFFKVTYCTYKNFGLQKFRINVNGPRSLNMMTDSTFLFRFPHFADLVLDNYFVVNLPNIWSPVVEILPQLNVNATDNLDFLKSTSPPRPGTFITRNFWPYEFRWIDNLGAQMIRRIRFIIGTTVIQEMTGQYLLNMVSRDFSETKKKLFDEMTGNTKELNDPANYAGRNGNYPNAIFNEDWATYGGEPSIRARKLYIPLNLWSTLLHKLPIPLVNLYRSNFSIEITCRPIQELFIVRYIPANRDIAKTFNEIMIRFNWGFLNPNDDFNEEELLQDLQDIQDVGDYVQPNQNAQRYSFVRFVNQVSPPLPGVDPEDTNGIRRKNGTISGTSFDNYDNQSSLWFADAHIMSTYVFLGDEEIIEFKKKPIKYLVRTVHETNFLGLTGKNNLRIKLDGLNSSLMWFFQRSDIYLKNQWSNYTNWIDGNLPFTTITNLTDGNTYRKRFINEFFYRMSSKIITSIGNPTNVENTNYKNFSFRFFTYSNSGDDISYQNFNSVSGEMSTTISETFELEKPIDEQNAQSNVARRLSAGKFKNIIGYFSALTQPFQITGPFHQDNNREIMSSWSLYVNGKLRENVLDSGVLNYVEKYIRTPGNGRYGVYCYNFTLDTSPFVYQPAGAMNTRTFSSNIDIEFNILNSEKDPNAKTLLILDPSMNVHSINKTQWNIFLYTYNLHLMEERYNFLTFENGGVQMKFN